MNARRPRATRTRTGKRLEITERDIEIFRWLARYRYLPSTYLHAFCGGASQKRFVERLGDLFHEGFIDRPSRQWDAAGCRYRPAVHELGQGGRRVLGGLGIVEEPRTWLAPQAHVQFAHAAMTCQILASIELALRQTADVRFISWPEILAKAPLGTQADARPHEAPVGTSKLVPDAMFGIAYDRAPRSTYRFFAVEADRGTMPVSRTDSSQSSLSSKLVSYATLIAGRGFKARWGLPNLFVLVVASGERVRFLVERTQTPLGSATHTLFRGVTRALSRTPDVSLLEQPWLRKEMEPLGLVN